MLKVRVHEESKVDGPNSEGLNFEDCNIAVLVLSLLLLFYILATSKVISGRIVTYCSAHSWRLYSAVSLGHQAADTMN